MEPGGAVDTGVPRKERIVGGCEGALADNIVGGDGPTPGVCCVPPASGKRGPPVGAPEPNTGGPLLTGPDPLEEGTDGPTKGEEDENAPGRSPKGGTTGPDCSEVGPARKCVEAGLEVKGGG